MDERLKQNFEILECSILGNNYTDVYSNLKEHQSLLDIAQGPERESFANWVISRDFCQCSDDVRVQRELISLVGANNAGYHGDKTVNLLLSKRSVISDSKSFILSEVVSTAFEGLVKEGLSDLTPFLENHKVDKEKAPALALMLYYKPVLSTDFDNMSLSKKRIAQYSLLEYLDCGVSIGLDDLGIELKRGGSELACYDFINHCMIDLLEDDFSANVSFVAYYLRYHKDSGLAENSRFLRLLSKVLDAEGGEVCPADVGLPFALFFARSGQVSSLCDIVFNSELGEPGVRFLRNEVGAYLEMDCSFKSPSELLSQLLLVVVESKSVDDFLGFVNFLKPENFSSDVIEKIKASKDFIAACKEYLNREETPSYYKFQILMALCFISGIDEDLANVGISVLGEISREKESFYADCFVGVLVKILDSGFHKEKALSITQSYLDEHLGRKDLDSAIFIISIREYGNNNPSVFDEFIQILEPVLSEEPGANDGELIERRIKNAAKIIAEIAPENSDAWVNAVVKLTLLDDSAKNNPYKMYSLVLEKSREQVSFSGENLDPSIIRAGRDSYRVSFNDKSLAYNGFRWKPQYDDLNWGYAEGKIKEAFGLYSESLKAGRGESSVEDYTSVIAESSYVLDRLNLVGSAVDEVTCQVKYILDKILDALSGSETYEQGLIYLSMFSNNIDTCTGGVQEAIDITSEFIRSSEIDKNGDLDLGDRILFDRQVSQLLVEWRKQMILGHEDLVVNVVNVNAFSKFFNYYFDTHSGLLIKGIIGAELGLRAKGGNPAFDVNIGTCRNLLESTSKGQLLSLFSSYYKYERIENKLLDLLYGEPKDAVAKQVTVNKDNLLVSLDEALDFSLLGRIENIAGGGFNPEMHPEYFVNPVRVPLDIDDELTYKELMSLEEGDYYYTADGVSQLGLVEIMKRLGYIDVQTV